MSRWLLLALPLVLALGGPAVAGPTDSDIPHNRPAPRRELVTW